MFIKVGRVYWIKPTPLPGYPSKQRPAIALSKYGAGKTIFIQIGSSDPKEPISLAATTFMRKSIGRDSIRKNNDKPSFTWIDPSKPEWNTSVIKPHIEDGEFLDIDHSKMKKIRQIYLKRMKELEDIRIRKAKGFILFNDLKKAKRQLEMLKNSDPIKHKNLDIDEFIKKHNK